MVVYMAGHLLHPLLRFKDEIDRMFAEKEESYENVYELFGGRDKFEEFQKFLRIVILEWNCGKEINEGVNWSDEELKKLKEVKGRRKKGKGG